MLPLPEYVRSYTDRAQQAGGSTAAAAPQRSLFHGIRPPPISIAAYVERIAKYAKCSPVCFVMAVTYMERAAEVRCCPKDSLGRIPPWTDAASDI